jgi:hypothetical protein
MKDFVREFKEVYASSGPTAYDKQILYLSKLADYYSTKEGWTSLVRVSMKHAVK